MSSPRPWDRDTRLERQVVETLKEFRLRALNKTRDRSFSLTEVARSSRHTPASLYNWETGICLPGSWSAWQAWAAALGLELRIELVAKDSQ